MKILSIITSAFILLYMLIVRHGSLLVRLSNCLFSIGLVYLCMALIIHVRNVGFFKLISYHNYKRKQRSIRQSGGVDTESVDGKVKIKTLHEFIQDKYSVQWKNSIFFLFSIPLLVLSLAFALISG